MSDVFSKEEEGKRNTNEEIYLSETARERVSQLILVLSGVSSVAPVHMQRDKCEGKSSRRKWRWVGGGGGEKGDDRREKRSKTTSEYQ